MGGAARDRHQDTAAPAADAGALISKYCLTCHNDQLKTAGLSLQNIDLTNVSEHAAVWEKVARKLRSGEMPPSNVRARPDSRTAALVVTQLEDALDRSAAAHPDPGRAPVHRLNRAEYSNAVRDLLAVDVRPGEWLPVDDSGYGFDNIAAVLSTSPALLDRYMAAARKISRLAVGDLTQKPAEEIYDAKRDPNNAPRNEQLNEDMPFDSRAGMTVKHYFPLDAEYVFKVRFAGVQTEGGDAESDPFQVRVPVRAGLHTIGVTSPRENLKPERESPIGAGAPGAGGRPSADIPSPVDLRLDGARVRRFDVRASVPDVTRLIVGGPYNPSGRGEPPSRQIIFSCHPARPAQESPCARTILTALAHRAFRRPVTSADVDPLLAFYNRARAASDFDGGIQAAIEAMLVSPEFLFRIERDPRRARGLRPQPSTASATSSSRRACRSSCGAAFPTRSCSGWRNRGGCSDAAVLEQQVRRMLEDPRADALVANFAGQWLHLRNVADGEARSGDLPVRRDAPPVVRDRNVAVRLEHLPRGSQPARSAVGRLHVPQPASGRALRRPARLRIAVSPRDAHRSEPARSARSRAAF